MSHMLPILLIKGVSSEVVLRPMGLLWKVCRKGRTPPSLSGRLPRQGFSKVGPLNLCLFTQRSTKKIAPSTNIKHHKYLAVQTHKDPDLPQQQAQKIEFHSIGIFICRFFNSALRSNFQKRVSGRFCQGRKLLSTKIIIKLFTRIHFAYKKKEIVIGVTPYL